jgi:hypothetical protein
MFVVLVRVITVPVLYCWKAERGLKKAQQATTG